MALSGNHMEMFWRREMSHNLRHITTTSKWIYTMFGFHCMWKNCWIWKQLLESLSMYVKNIKSSYQNHRELLPLHVKKRRNGPTSRLCPKKKLYSLYFDKRYVPQNSHFFLKVDIKEFFCWEVLSSKFIILHFLRVYSNKSLPFTLNITDKLLSTESRATIYAQLNHLHHPHSPIFLPIIEEGGGGM